MNMKFHKNEMKSEHGFYDSKMKMRDEISPFWTLLRLIGKENGNISNLINWSFSDNTHIFHVTSQECLSSHCIRNCRVKRLKWFIQIRCSVFFLVLFL